MRKFDINTRRVPCELSPSIRVAVGDVHLPFLTLAKIDGKFFVSLHEKRCLPEPRAMSGKEDGVLHRGGLRYKKISERNYNIVLQGIIEHEKVQGYHINPHTFLYAWCLAREVDLYQEDILTL